MAKAPPAFQFYPSDFMAGTAHLDAEAIGCYLLLLCFQWMHGFLHNDMSKMARICKKTVPEFTPIWHQISDKFAVVDGGGLLNERMETVRARAVALSEKRSASGRIGGQANASRLPKQKTTKGRLKVEDRNLKPNKKKDDASPFAAWWELVPRKAARGDAAKAYDKAVDRLRERGQDDPHGFLCDRIKAFAVSDVAKGEYCPYPATWLNKERYDDDPATWQRGSPRNNTDPRGNLALRDKLLAEMEST